MAPSWKHLGLMSIKYINIITLKVIKNKSEEMLALSTPCLKKIQATRFKDVTLGCVLTWHRLNKLQKEFRDMDKLKINGKGTEALSE